MKITKYINSFLTAFFLVFCIACEDENKDIIPNKDREIRFDCVDTKADITNASQIDEFGVFAEHNLGSPSTAEAGQWSSILSNERVYRNDEGNFVYDPNKTIYLMNDRTFRFFAVWPYSNDVTATANSGEYQVPFSTPVDADADLLAAFHSVDFDADYASNYIVPFTFEHRLSKFRLEISQDFVKNQYDYFWIESVELANIKKTGVLTTSHSDKEGDWYFNEERLTFKKDIPTEQQLLQPSTYLGPWGGDGVGLNLIPQAFSSGEITLKINYKYQQNGYNELDADIEDKTVMTSLPVGEWKPGKTYTYKIQLYESNLIVFRNIEVAGWGASIPGGAIIIK